MFHIRGPCRLNGEVMISGAKNAALPILFASLLTNKTVHLNNVPYLNDINVTLQLFSRLGVKVNKQNDSLLINATNLNKYTVPMELAKAMRASIWILAPLLARFGKAELFFPGGCAIGARPIDLHICALEKLGAVVHLEGADIIKVTVNSHLNGANISMVKTSVGATITAIIAATLAIGTTVIENAALEPEVCDTANFLNSVGARISGIGTSNVTIEGVNNLSGGFYRIMPDRIETGTFLVAAAISRARIVCHNTRANTLTIVLDKLRETGAKIEINKDSIILDMQGKWPKAIDIHTQPYPGFPTDLQAQFTLLNSMAIGAANIKEDIFENRFMHVPELIKMGCQIEIYKNHIVCNETKQLAGTKVIATDLRASATLALAGCIAKGTTIIDHIFHIDRGYERFEEKLRKLGANIERI